MWLVLVQLIFMRYSVFPYEPWLFSFVVEANVLVLSLIQYKLYLTLSQFVNFMADISTITLKTCALFYQLKKSSSFCVFLA